MHELVVSYSTKFYHQKLQVQFVLYLLNKYIKIQMQVIISTVYILKILYQYF